MITARPVHALACAAAAAAVLLSGCSSESTGQPGSTPATTISGLSGTDPATCAHFAAQPIAADAPLATVIVDRTGSVRDLELSPDLAPVLAQIQSTGAVMQTIGVNGSGVPPTVGKPISLDPAPGKTSRTADQHRQAALGCVRDWLHTPDTLPVGDNTDLLAAMSGAARQAPSQIVVISDGINTTAELNLFTAPVDPVATADQVRRGGTWTLPAGVPVHWFHLAETSPPLPETDRTAVTGFWTALLGADLHLHTRTGTTAPTGG
ncbi:hypothetical protein [Rhodococcus sp. NCIMB 12038]|uniref:hypothetical protein n=1 Tax=Rhodococcus sp. NCIMB 12038 TaxID=933800 RepID=UPI000B3CC14C|nr:hypothetical protein [Rhodococcus sp. NCIMB 12038]OUS97271.1 hypothetical protein CA951_02690 [Rhodococcus sp. NCIMB 12038]